MTTRRLVLIRHAKAEPYAATDRSRDLTDRGRREATAAGEHLQATGVRPDYAVVSPSARTRATWELAAKAMGADAEVVYDTSVYTGGADAVLATLQAVPEDTSVLAFVGHNPAVAHLAHVLEDGTGDVASLQRMMAGFPPGSTAVFEVEVPWAELGPETGRLVDFRPGAG